MTLSKGDYRGQLVGVGLREGVADSISWKALKAEQRLFFRRRKYSSNLLVIFCSWRSVLLISNLLSQHPKLYTHTHIHAFPLFRLNSDWSSVKPLHAVHFMYSIQVSCLTETGFILRCVDNVQAALVAMAKNWKVLLYSSLPF